MEREDVLTIIVVLKLHKTSVFILQRNLIKWASSTIYNDCHYNLIKEIIRFIAITEKKHRKEESPLKKNKDL